jgi:large subunit ribosomal protein L33
MRSFLRVSAFPSQVNFTSEKLCSEKFFMPMFAGLLDFFIASYYTSPYIKKNKKYMSQDHLVKLACGKCKSVNYMTTRNKKQVEKKLTPNKHCSVCRKHTPHKEAKK